MPRTTAALENVLNLASESSRYTRSERNTSPGRFSVDLRRVPETVTSSISYEKLVSNSSKREQNLLLHSQRMDQLLRAPASGRVLSKGFSTEKSYSGIVSSTPKSMTMLFREVALLSKKVFESMHPKTTELPRSTVKYTAAAPSSHSVVDAFTAIQAAMKQLEQKRTLAAKSPSIDSEDNSVIKSKKESLGK